MVIEGLKLTVLGMGMVFIFLVLLVSFIHLTSYLLAGITQKELAFLEEESMKNASTQKGGDKSTLVAVIAAAISAYRKDKNN